MELYSKVTDLPREQLGEGESGLGKVCVQVVCSVQDYHFLITVYLCSLLLQWQMENSMSTGNKGDKVMRREQNKGRGEATEKLNNSNRAIGKGADYLSHIAATEVSAAKR